MSACGLVSLATGDKISLHDLLEELFLLRISDLGAGKCIAKQCILDPLFRSDLRRHHLPQRIGPIFQFTTYSVAADVVDDSLGREWAILLQDLVQR